MGLYKLNFWLLPKLSSGKQKKLYVSEKVPFLGTFSEIFSSQIEKNMLK